VGTETFAADVVYTNAQVVTMEEDQPTAEAVATKWDKIIAVGSNASIQSLAGPDTQTVDLGNRTMLPGLIEPHNHFHKYGYVALLWVDLQSPPMGQITTMNELIEALRETADKTPKGQWVCGRGYDDTLISEKRHPTRHDLDKVSTEHPVWIVHTSGHFSSANSKALEIGGITRDTPQPSGGVIRKDLKTGEPDGVLEERPAQILVARHLPPLTMEQRLEGIDLAAKNFLKTGVTSTYDAGVVFPGEDRIEIVAFQKAITQGILPIRTTMMVGIDFLLGEGDGASYLTGFGDPRLKIGPAKIIVDGSIQGYTGWLTRPYHVPFREDPSYCGYPVTSPEQLNPLVLEAQKAGLQVAAHGNGDAAIDAILEAYRLAREASPRPDTRHRIEHCQTVREDQLDTIAAQGVSPSFFVSHTYYWGDRHKAIFLGPERATRISPLKSAVNRGIRFSIHSDSPVTPVSPLFCVFAAVNRITKEGEVLGPEFRLTPEEALRAVTIDAAWQNFDEDIKGSIRPGKLADFTILAEHPYHVPPETIKDIRVDKVVIGGQLGYETD
jgi:predicted amidohydrolase YtcJ